MTLPKPGSKARWITIGYGILALVWLGIEDSHDVLVVLLGIGLSGLLAIWGILGKLGGKTIARRYVMFGAAILGAGIGLGTGITTFGLMMVKNVQHAHPSPHFSPELMLAAVLRAPAWAVIGGLVGSGLALAWLALRAGEHKP